MGRRGSYQRRVTDHHADHAHGSRAEISSVAPSTRRTPWSATAPRRSRAAPAVGQHGASARAPTAGRARTAARRAPGAAGEAPGSSETRSSYDGVEVGSSPKRGSRVRPSSPSMPCSSPSSRAGPQVVESSATAFRNTGLSRPSDRANRLGFSYGGLNGRHLHLGERRDRVQRLDELVVRVAQVRARPDEGRDRHVDRLARTRSAAHA